MLFDFARLLIGGLFLYYGAEWLVRGSAGLARAFGVTPFVIGATVVAYGTSAPELTVGIAATLEDKGGIAIGNVVGSNIANVGLILGITALISPPRVEASVIRREVPVMVLVTFAMVGCVYDGVVGRIEAAVLALGAVVFSLWMLKADGGGDDSEPESEVEEVVAKSPGRARLIGLTVLGLAVLVGGGKVFVDGASAVAMALGMSERTVGLSIVAVGTSLPELAASLVAAMRGHADLAIGNVIGSNIFNILLIIGVSALVRPLGMPVEGLWIDLGTLVAITFVAVWVMRGKRQITRTEGVFMLTLYVAFIVSLFFR